jgi:hypothetical protein
MKPENQAKVDLFLERFRGLDHVYGTYDWRSGRAWQVKAPITPEVILAHLRGVHPYGVYLLTGDRTRAVVADFDHDDGMLPVEFVVAARHYGVSAYIERSKSKGFHVWSFFHSPGTLAKKARVVFRHILAEVGHPSVEVFPKQDVLTQGTDHYGNFINAPLFGRLVTQAHGLEPYLNQWAFLGSVECVPEATLDEIIEINGLGGEDKKQDATTGLSLGVFKRSSCLPPCAQHMLFDGVSENQRVACFRLAIHLKQVGLPYEFVVAVLREWARKNHPMDGKGIITTCEIKAQAEGQAAKTRPLPPTVIRIVRSTKEVATTARKSSSF